MRLIDADALKEWVENWFTMNRHYHPYSKSNNIPTTELIDIIDRMPTVNAVEVVRCKNCEYSFDYYNDGECYCTCPNVDIGWVKDWNFYCKAAERKQS